MCECHTHCVRECSLTHMQETLAYMREACHGSTGCMYSASDVTCVLPLDHALF